MDNIFQRVSNVSNGDTDTQTDTDTVSTSSHGPSSTPSLPSFTRSYSTGLARLGDADSILQADPRRNAWWEEIIAIISMAMLFGWVGFGPWLTFASIYFTVVHRSQLAALFLAFVLTASFAPTGGYWPAFRHWWLWDTWRRYFRTRLVTPPVPFLHPGRPYLAVHFPHSVFPMGSFLSLAICGVEGTGFPDSMTGAIANVLFHLPVMRQIYYWMGCIPAEKPEIMKALKRGPVGLVPEGVAGIFLGATRDQERIYASKHKGYAKLALRAGADILVVYQLGQSQMLSFWGWPHLSRRLRASVGFFWGRWGLPLLPRRHDIFMLVANPIPVAQVDNPTQADIDTLHDKVLSTVVELFDQHKGLMPDFAHKKLQIV